MKHTREEVFHLIREQNIKAIRLAFCDVFGNEKNISVTPKELSQAFEHGIAINASEIKNFGEGIYCDLLLHPLPETLSLIPWTGDGEKTVRMFCSMTYPDGTPFTHRGTKSILLQAAECADKAGYEFYFSADLPYYLFLRDKNGKPTNIPADEAGYLDIEPEDGCEAIRREISSELEQMEYKATNMYHGQGPGQNVVAFGFDNPVTAGDSIITAKAIIKNVAKQHGLYADFSPKPLKDYSGNGLHIGISVRSDDGTSNAMDAAMAGVLEHIDAMTAFINYSKESYERIAEHRALQYVTWSSENRAQLMRIPETVGHFKKAELRSPDSLVNPYLAFALLIYASLDGIERHLTLPPAANFEFENATSMEQFKKLPHTMEEAARLAGESAFIRAHLHEDIIKLYLKQ